MFERIFQRLATLYMSILAQCRLRFFKNWCIKRLIRKHEVDLSCVAEPDIEKYINFNAFFTRALKPESRPIASNPAAIASPADGFISQIGTFHEKKIIQAKNMDYDVDRLLGCDANQYGLKQGYFANIYLSPKDYHRVHLPLSGRLIAMTHIPGSLFSVNPTYVASIPHLFTRNERVIAFFETEAGTMAIALIGAMVVGKIQVVWNREASAFKGRKIKHWNYQNQNLTFHKGDEIGRFLVGSTVIALFSKSHEISWHQNLLPQVPVKMGEELGLLQNLKHGLD